MNDDDNNNDNNNDNYNDNNNDVETYENFDEMDLDIQLLKGIYGHGFSRPSYIQQKAIIPLIKGKNVIAQAQSGTGKTGAFSIGLLSLINISKLYCQGLILAPTRELAEQITKVISEIGIWMKIKCHMCIGGTDWKEDIRILKDGVHIIIGTPGRVYDMLRREAIDGSKIRCIILDEADEMLSTEGFQDIVYDIFQELDKEVQIGLFSATMPPSLFTLTKKFMKDPIKISVRTEHLTLEGIRQYYVDVEKEEYKFDTLCNLYNEISINSCVIFCNTTKVVQWLANNMMKNDFVVTAIYGKLDQKERNKIMKNFRLGTSRVLITTDILARGIDVQHVSVVINYDLPKSKENYLHRIGRSGRFGRKGVAINFVTKNDADEISKIEEFYNTQIDALPKSISDLL